LITQLLIVKLLSFCVRTPASPFIFISTTDKDNPNRIMPKRKAPAAAVVAEAAPAKEEEEASAEEEAVAEAPPAAKSPKKSGDAPVKRGRGRPPMSAEKRAKKEAAKAAKAAKVGTGKGRGRPKQS